MERKLNKSIATASREGLRTYARGRLYDPDRYPTFPYQDPNDLYHAILEQAEAEKKDGGEKKAVPAPEEKEAPVQAVSEQLPETAEPVPAPAEEAAEEAFVEESFLEEPETESET